MKLNRLLTISALGLTVMACNTGNQMKTKASLETEIDSVSYALGVNIGSQLRNDPSAKDIDANLYIQGFLNAKDSSNLMLDLENSRKTLTSYFKKKQEEEKKKQQAEGEKNKVESEKFLAENKTKPGIKTTESGLQYEVIKEGSGTTPKADDTVKVHYHGTLINGTVFDSSVDRGEPMEFGVSSVIKGWTEGLQLMKPGSKYKFYIPQELAYGPRQRGPKIKPYSALIFDVELIEVKDKK